MRPQCCCRPIQKFSVSLLLTDQLTQVCMYDQNMQGWKKIFSSWEACKISHRFICISCTRRHNFPPKSKILLQISKFSPNLITILLRFSHHGYISLIAINVLCDWPLLTYCSCFTMELLQICLV